jgi:NitT/TauT family transport system substrate-binding protein
VLVTAFLGRLPAAAHPDTETASPSTEASPSADSAAPESSDSAELDHLTLQLKWIDHAQFMGYLVAAEKGYFEDETVEGASISKSSRAAAISSRAERNNGVADIGVTWVSSLMTYQAQGYDLQEVAQMFQKSGLCLSRRPLPASIPPKISRARTSAAGFGQRIRVYALLEKYGLKIP